MVEELHTCAERKKNLSQRSTYTLTIFPANLDSWILESQTLLESTTCTSPWSPAMIPEISAHNKTRITTITIQYFTMNKTSLLIILFLQLGLRVWTLATRCADINCRAVSDEFDRPSWKLWQTGSSFLSVESGR